MVSYSLVEILIFLCSQTAQVRRVRDTSPALIGEAGFSIQDPQRFATHFGRFILEENERFNNQHNIAPLLQQSPVPPPFHPQRQPSPSPSSSSSSLLLQLALQAQNSNNPPIRFPGPETGETFRETADFVVRAENGDGSDHFTLSEKLVVTTPRSIFSRPNSQSRETLLRKLNNFASNSPILSTPLPNLSPQSRKIQNPLLQTLFQNQNFEEERNPFPQLGLQGLSRPSGQGGGVLQVKERELLEKQREIEMLLDDRNEKERLLIEALRKQSSQRQSVVTTTTPPSTPIYTTVTTAREEFRSSGFEEEEEEEEEDEDYKVEIILEMTRELVEATHKQRSNLSEEVNEFSEDLFGKSFEPEMPENIGTPLEAIVNARNAVLKTMKSGNERTSPAIWAAVKILSDFVETQQPGIPPDVLVAIIQLTEFLNAEETGDNDNEDDEDDGEDDVAPVVIQPSRVPPTTTEKQTLLSPDQVKLRDKLLKQKVMKQEEINKIIQRSKLNQQPPSSSQFPERIHLMDVSLDGQQFSFSTLPVY